MCNIHFKFIIDREFYYGLTVISGRFQNMMENLRFWKCKMCNYEDNQNGTKKHMEKEEMMADITTIWSES